MNSESQRFEYSAAVVARTFAEGKFVAVENKSFFNLSVTDESLLWRSLLLSITTEHQQWLDCTNKFAKMQVTRNLTKFAWNRNARLLIWFAFPKWNLRLEVDNIESQIICISCILCAASRKKFHSEFNDFSGKVWLCRWRKQSVENVSEKYSKWFHLNFKTLIAFFINRTFKQFQTSSRTSRIS